MVGKIIGLLLVAAAAVVIVKPLREQVSPHLAFAFDPFYEWSTRNRVSEISDMVKRMDQLGRPIPTAKELPDFIERESFQRNGSLDPWGTPYYLQRTRNGFRIGSAGKDRRRGSADDIVSAEERLVTPQGNRRR